MKKRTIWADLKCSICSKEGSWPFIPFHETGEHVSARPSDCAAVIPAEDVRDRDIDMHPSTFEILELPFESICPDCFRMASTAEANGLHKSCFHGITEPELNSVLMDEFPVGTISTEDVRKAFLSFPEAIDMSDFYGGTYIEDTVFSDPGELSNNPSRSTFLPMIGTIGDPIGLFLTFKQEIQHSNFSPTAKLSVWAEAKWGDDESWVRCSFWPTMMPDEERVLAYSLLFDSFYAIYQAMQRVRISAVDRIRDSLSKTTSSNERSSVKYKRNKYEQYSVSKSLEDFYIKNAKFLSDKGKLAAIKSQKLKYGL